MSVYVPKCVPSCGDPGPKHTVPWAHPGDTPNSTSIGLSVFAGLTVVTSRHTQTHRSTLYLLYYAHKLDVQRLALLAHAAEAVMSERVCRSGH